MGRPKQFDRDQILDQAIEVFRCSGFHGTSVQQLVDALGINRKSVYGEFGSKQGLFEAALARYDQITVSANFGPLESSASGLKEIETVIRMFAGAARSGGSGLGCLLCNTAAGGGANHPETRPLTDHYIDRMTGAFENALTNAKAQGEVLMSTDTLSHAQFFAASVLGLAVLVRAKAAPSMLDGAAEVILSHLNALKRRSP